MSDKKNERFVPPVAISKAAALGLELHEKYNKGGTKIGWARAKQLKNREAIDITEIKKITSYFARHEVDKLAKDFGNDKKPSKGYIAWLLWGGDACKQWADEIKNQNARKDKHK